MKAYIFLALILALSSAQTPIPLPSFTNISALNGEWYVVWGYQSNFNIPAGIEFSCFTWDIEVGETGGVIDLFVDLLGQSSNSSIPIVTYGAQNTVWDDILYWVGVDPVNLSWATIGQQHNSTSNVTGGFIISRSPSLNQVIINSQILLLKGEGFAFNSTNAFQVSNSACSSDY